MNKNERLTCVFIVLFFLFPSEVLSPTKGLTSKRTNLWVPWAIFETHSLKSLFSLFHVGLFEGDGLAIILKNLESVASSFQCNCYLELLPKVSFNQHILKQKKSTCF